VFATIMPAIFMAVAALVLNVMMARLIDQQRTIIGTLKAIGYGNIQIFWHFAKFGAAMGLGGGLVGLGLGYLMSMFVISLYRMFYEFPDLSNHVYPGTYLGAASRSVCYAAARLAASAALGLTRRPKPCVPPPAQGAIWLGAFAVWRHLSLLWLVLRNLFRNRLRLRGRLPWRWGAGLLVTGFMLAGALNYLISFQFEHIQ
jgi:putative ABC transport system permease protein